MRGGGRRDEGGRRAGEERKTIWAGQQANQGEDESDAMLHAPKRAVFLPNCLVWKLSHSSAKGGVSRGKNLVSPAPLAGASMPLTYRPQCCPCLEPQQNPCECPWGRAWLWGGSEPCAGRENKKP